MSQFSSLRLAEMLQRERPLLDKIIGSSTYQIEDAHPDEVTVRSDRFVLRFGYDRDRVGDVRVCLSAGGPTSEPVHSLEIWARFLGEDWPPLPMDAGGKTTVSAEQQVRDHLDAAARLVKEIFSEPQRARDASFFANGYLEAYNDWASGKGCWKHSH